MALSDIKQCPICNKMFIMIPRAVLVGDNKYKMIEVLIDHKCSSEEAKNELI